MYTHHENGDFTVVCETLNGEKINVRFEGQPKIKYSEIEIGKTYDVIGGVSKYGDTYQLMIGNRKGDASNDFKLSNVVSESTVAEVVKACDGEAKTVVFTGKVVALTKLPRQIRVTEIKIYR